MLHAYRIVHGDFVDSAWTGLGARQNGGRWNSPGRPAVYLASTRSLCMLELMVHLDDYAALELPYLVAEVAIPEDLVTVLPPAELPSDWNAWPHPASTRLRGDQWLDARRTPALCVPSVVTPAELNYVLNPLHPDFERIQRGDFEPIRFDPRLRRGRGGAG
jgi:RES domain-containing protein